MNEEEQDAMASLIEGLSTLDPLALTALARSDSKVSINFERAMIQVTGCDPDEVVVSVPLSDHQRILLQE